MAPRPDALTRFLADRIGFDTAQLAAVDRDEAVVKVLDARERRDVVVFGIVTLPVSRDAWARAARDFPAALRTPNRTQVGLFSNPATAADVAELTIEMQDVKDMKDCKPGDCVAKLPATDMRRIREQINWSAPQTEIQKQLTAYGHRRLIEYVTDYRARGDSALVVYDDRGTMNVHASDAFAAQLAESPYVFDYVPSLLQYLRTYPRGSLPGAAEVIYWSRDALPRLRPILSVNHLVVYTPPERPNLTLVASKQIWANHYFETAFDLSCIVERPAGSYLLVLRRFRFDNLPGGILNIRGKAIGALRDQLAADLRRQQHPAGGAR
jgi:hypothetical protein